MSPAPALVERDEVVATVEAAVERARSGRGGAVFLRGEAGLGKTAVLERVASAVPSAVAIRWAHGRPAEVDLPFAFAEQVLGPLDAARPLAEDPLDRRASVHEAARSAIRVAARRGPLVLLLDDLHWSDPDSIALVGFVVRRLAELPVAVVGAMRPWPPEAWAMAESVAAEGLAHLAAVTPLAAASSRGVLEALVGGPIADGVADDVWTLTGGSPLLLGEAARTITGDGALPEWGGHGAGSPGRALLLSHLAGLPEEALEVARAAAVLGGRLRLPTVQAVAGLDDEAFARGFDTLVAAGVLRPEGPGWAELGHELLGAAIDHDLPPARRRLLHLRAFRDLVGRGDRAGATPHALAADLVGDGPAVGAATEAGTQAVREGALETGVALLEAAVTLSGADPAAELLTAQADTYFVAGRPEEALEVHRRLLSATTDPGDRRSILAKMARAEAYTGRFVAALGLYDQLLDGDPDLGPEGPALVAEHAHVAWERDGPAGALAVLERSRPLLGAPAVLDPLIGYFELQTGEPGHLEALYELGERARHQLVARPGDASASFNGITLAVSACAMTERHDQAFELIDAGCASLRAVGAVRFSVPLRITRIGILLNQGRLTGALAEIDDLEEELELGALLQPHLTAFRALALVRLGRQAEAAAASAAAAAMAGSDAWFVALNLGMVRGELDLARGRPEAAWGEYRRVEEQVAALRLGEPCTPRWASGALESALATGRVEDAERIVGWLRARVAGLPCQWPRAVALAGEGGCRAARGDVEGADASFTAALELPWSDPVGRAGTLLHYGSWLRRSNQRLRSRAPLADALALAESIGAVPLAERARRELAAAGGRRRRGRPGPSELSVQEARVARLALQRATTREIAAELHLSPRTVESHLSRVYTKLGVSSKRQLADHRSELGADPR